MNDHAVEQAIRISHCSNTGKEHACVGVCTITRSGVNLSCTLCGSDDKKFYQPNEWLEDRLKEIFHKAGMRFDSLTDEAKSAALKEYARDFCPNCKRVMFHTQRYNNHHSCSCGWSWSNYSGWRAPQMVPETSPASTEPDLAGGNA